MKAYNSSKRGSAASRDALDKMAQFASTFDDWKNIFYRARSGSALEELALAKMAALSETFGQWLNVYQESPKADADIEGIALN